MVITERRQLATSGQGDAHDITELTSAAVRRSGLNAGVATVFVTRHLLI